MTLIDKITDDLMKRHAWLLRAGPIAKQLNEQSRKDQ